MIAQVSTVAFQGVDVLHVDVQVQLTSGLPAFTIVGLPDKAVAESRERVRGAFHALGLSLPAKRITVNLAPADVQKEGSHYDLPIALGLMGSLGLVPEDVLQEFYVLGELGLDGRLSPVPGVLPAALHAASAQRGLICPEECGGEAAWGGDLNVLAPSHLLTLLNHFKGHQTLSSPEPRIAIEKEILLDMRDIKGQVAAKRALEIAAAGGHNLLMSGPPGAGKSMLARRLPSILPPLTPKEALEVTMIHSLSGSLTGGHLMHRRPYRDPHHSTSMPALVGGGHKAQPGEISLAHHGVLFLDELPEFQRNTLESLRQPLETGTVTISRANAHVRYPARFQLIAAMNPCRCGHLDDASRACARAPRCGDDYQNRLSGPLLDRIDLFTFVPELSFKELTQAPDGEASEKILMRVEKARTLQGERQGCLNAHMKGEDLEKTLDLGEAGLELLKKAAEKFHLSARGYYRVLKVARTLADMENSLSVLPQHLAEALQYRRQ